MHSPNGVGPCKAQILAHSVRVNFMDFRKEENGKRRV